MEKHSVREALQLAVHRLNASVLQCVTSPLVIKCPSGACGCCISCIKQARFYLIALARGEGRVICGYCATDLGDVHAHDCDLRICNGSISYEFWIYVHGT
jgi:hypothetical protein